MWLFAGFPANFHDIKHELLVRVAAKFCMLWPE